MANVRSAVNSPPRRNSPLIEGLRRVLAGSCAALVLALTIFSASPVAHNSLHVDGAQPAQDDGCAVVLFASGVALPVGPITVPAPSETPQAISPATAAEVFLVSPRYLRHPERGPPAIE